MSNMYGGIGDAFVGLFRFMTVLLGIFVPLGVWKLIDILIWVFSHIKIVAS